ncbi:hypothetical protein [uncultured Cohaesibacter sp.]|nr:hypothetical protein [uncultured Cohaesibacter sp.]
MQPANSKPPQQTAKATDRIEKAERVLDLVPFSMVLKLELRI